MRIFSKTFIDVDDTLIKTTKTLDKYANKVYTKYKEIDKRWDNHEKIIEILNFPLVIEPYEGTKELVSTLENMSSHLIICSACPEIKYSRQNRRNAVKKITDIPILFFDSDNDKKRFLENNTDYESITIDDKKHILKNLKGTTVLINPELNPDADCSISMLMEKLLK